MSERTALVGDIQKFSTEDGPGIRTTVFLKGCPLRCKWCHNPEMIDFNQEVIKLPNSCISCLYCVAKCPQKAITFDRETKKIDIDREKCNVCLTCVKECYPRALRAVAEPMTAEQIMYKVLQDKGFYGHTGGGMTVSGGEMLAQADFVNELLDIAEANDIKACLDTCGHGDGEKLYAMAKRDVVSNILFDMKFIDTKLHEEYTGVGNELILANLLKLASDDETRAKIMMRMPLIHDVNDTDDIIRRTGEFYKEHGLTFVTLLPYHNLGVSKSRNVGQEPVEFTSPSDERLEEIRDFFEKECGMTVEILGKQVR